MRYLAYAILILLTLVLVEACTVGPTIEQECKIDTDCAAQRERCQNGFCVAIVVKTEQTKEIITDEYPIDTIPTEPTDENIVQDGGDRDEIITPPDVTPEHTPSEILPEPPPEVEPIPEDVPEVTPDDVPEVTPDDVPEVTPDDVPEVTPDDMPEVTPDNVPEVTPDDVPEVTPEGVVQGLPFAVFLYEQGSQIELTPLMIEVSGTLKEGPQIIFNEANYGWKGRVIVAMDGKDLYIARQEVISGANTYEIELHELFSTYSPQIASLGNAEPTALWAREKRCHIGIYNQTTQVNLADFRILNPSVTNLYNYTNPTAPRKEVDAFAHSGSDLIAVDNIMTPKYAFVFELNSDFIGTHKFTAELPAGINETVRGADISGDLLFVWSSYGIQSGYGQKLLATQIDKVTQQFNTVWNVSEFEPQQPTNPETPPTTPTLLVGNNYTAWQGIAAYQGRLFIAGGDRGIIHLPYNTTTAPAATQFATRGACTDIIAYQGRLLALTQVSATQSSLLILEWDITNNQLVISSSYNLTHRANRFPR